MCHLPVVLIIWDCTQKQVTFREPCRVKCSGRSLRLIQPCIPWDHVGRDGHIQHACRLLGMDTCMLDPDMLPQDIVPTLVYVNILLHALLIQTSSNSAMFKISTSLTHDRSPSKIFWQTNWVFHHKVFCGDLDEHDRRSPWTWGCLHLKSILSTALLLCPFVTVVGT